MISPNPTVGLKIKDIEGCLVNKIDLALYKSPHFRAEIVGRNNCIDEQGEVSITLNREKLADLIDIELSKSTWGADIIADSIISELKNIVEVVQCKNG